METDDKDNATGRKGSFKNRENSIQRDRLKRNRIKENRLKKGSKEAADVREHKADKHSYTSLQC